MSVAYLLADPSESARGLLRALCPDCGQDATFYSQPFTGISRQRCGCGDVRMKPHRDQPLVIPTRLQALGTTPDQPHMVMHECEICGAWHRTTKVEGSRTCQAKCRRILLKREGTWRGR